MQEKQDDRGSGALAEILDRIDGRGYKAYRDIEGEWRYAEWTLFVDRVQADPFAAPSKLRVRIAQDYVGLPDGAISNRVRRIACASWLARSFDEATRRVRPPRTGTGKSGLITIDAGGAEVIERTAIVFGESFVEARIELGLPATGRRVLGNAASILLIEVLPKIVDRAFLGRDEDRTRELTRFIDCIENQEFVRNLLQERELVAFIGDGAILPRESGASEGPMAKEDALPFSSPQAHAIEIEVPHTDAGAPGRIWRGMGIPRGVILLVGGGYHGKSTLLRAIERGVTPHIPGDGRESVVSDASLVKIRAEDGRSVCGVDIQGFIDDLPAAPGRTTKRSTQAFSSDDASGSTSQAANIVEAIEAGATGLLLDEDTSATNFMVRDAKMQALIHPKDEPITPFLHRVRELFDRFGTSTILVMGGSGDYFDVADTVIEMKAFAPRDVTARAKEIAQGEPMVPPSDFRAALRQPTHRVPDPASFDARRGRQDVKVSTRDLNEIVYGTTAVDLSGVEQLFDPSQTRAIGSAILLATTRFMKNGMTISKILDELEHAFDEEGLDQLDPFHREDRHPGAFARPRRFEIAAAINRMRTLRLLRSN